ncbi:hypothetical protein ACFLQO_01375, partial [Candidatus Aenigmatarchaeota archaeon]
MEFRNMLILATVAILLLVTLPLASAADVSKEWICGSGMTCISDSCGTYKKIANNDYSFNFAATPGTYTCEVEVRNCCYGFIGTVPEKNEYADIYLNNERVGLTEDLFCNTVIDDPPEEPCVSAACPYGCGSPNAGGGDIVTGGGGGYCDDDPNDLGNLGSSAVIVIDMTGCGTGSKVFIRKNIDGKSHLPRCQTWDWTDTDCPTKLNELPSLVEDEIVHIQDCTKDVKRILVGSGSYTVGSWTPSPGSEIKYCVTYSGGVPPTEPCRDDNGNGDDECYDPADCGNKEVCCKNECVYGECCIIDDCDP